MQGIGARVHLARHRAGLTSAELARQVGVTPDDVARIEHEQPPAPPALLLRHIAHAVGVDPRWLLRGDAGAPSRG